MKRRLFLRSASAAPVSLAVSSALPLASAKAAGNVDRGTAPYGALDIVAEFDGPGPSGIVVLPNGRTFVGFPRHAIDHKGATLGELIDGKVVPYPSVSMSMPGARPTDCLVSVHGMTMDRQGRLWMIDDGKRAGHPLQPGAAKIVCVDPQTNRVVHKIILKAPVLLNDSHMNDLRVSLSHGAQGTVFVTDSSFGNSPGLVIVDVATQQARRVLTTHPAILPEEGFMAIVEGEPRRYIAGHPQLVSGGVDGIALTKDEKRLYFAPLTSRRLYSISVDLLADPASDDAVLGPAIQNEGEKGVADGLALDDHGRLYTTNYEHDCILRRDPDGSFHMMLRDPRALSPDGIFATADHVYCTFGQWNRLASFNEGVDRRAPPYLLIRFPIEQPKPYDALPHDPDQGKSPGQGA
ncbi:SMP-30/gluconolactonase/LRE family protein [Gluconobacter kanchanaburiensis]|uniref:SMP-30/gluconolactonase/LRE family protein n=1 Tax=Gluconobacter kanchanaburiensis TaxID=563199 RepID=UPI0011BFB4CF|nr:L-dopachrome tautomerase-related protein [Gluconobacter kanchanaburiensis]MBF0861341.1 gluconolactonase [Gluconobacter kanchanaburiensis]